MSEPDAGPRPSDDEWAFLIEDPEETCVLCGEAVRPAQAVGHVDGQVVHAKCYQEQRRAA